MPREIVEVLLPEDRAATFKGYGTPQDINTAMARYIFGIVVLVK